MAVSLLAITAAVYNYTLYWPRYEAYINWDSSAHYMHALNFAHAIRQCEPITFLKGIESARQWPPMFSFIQVPFLLLGGYSFRLATLPSLFCFIGTALLVFLLSVHFQQDGISMVVALAASTLVLTNMAFQHHALRILMESTGSFLVLLAIYCYLQTLRASDRRHWMAALGVSLSILFFLKYNYWAFVIATIVGYEYWHVGSERQRALWRWLARPCQDRFIQLAGLVMMGFILAWFLVRGGVIQGSRKLPMKLSYAVYLNLLVILARWFTSPLKPWQAIAPAYQHFILSGILPVMIWFAIPKKLGYFLRFLFNNPGTSLQSPMYYLDHFLQAYHISAGVGYVILGLSLVSLVCLRWLPPGSGLIAFYVVLATVAALLHPNRQWRHLMVIVPFYWILAALGLQYLLHRIPQRTLRVVCLAGLLGIWVATTAPAVYQLYTSGHDTYHHRSRASQYGIKSITAHYLPRCRQYHKITFLATSVIFSKHFLKWTFLQAYPRRPVPQVGIRKFAPRGSVAANRKRFNKWLQRTDSDLVVLIDHTPGLGDEIKGYESLKQYKDFMAQQQRYRPCYRQRFVRGKSRTVVTFYSLAN